ncbi:MAG TPA: HD domain-containing protein [Candidatus Magasanikbacteria bacterium]|nr:HD domain-containing protein [Candidatus Magasanikbacteria bacterium]
MNKTQKLINVGLKLMEKTHDPLHNRNHVERVISTTQTIAHKQNLSDHDTQALALAAAWHDVARIITRRPSMFIMLALDDLFSAFMLTWYGIINFSFRYEVRIAIWLLLAKSAITGRIIKLTMLRRRYRTLLQILKDADVIDVIHPERTSIAFDMAQNSRYYRTGYRMLIRWTLRTRPISTYTMEARDNLFQNLQIMRDWVMSPPITKLHTMMFGPEWAEIYSISIERLIRENSPVLDQKMIKSSS